jgi:molybdate transport system substrate-binding protein
MGIRLPIMVALAAVAVVCPARSAEAGPPGKLTVAAAANLIYALDGIDAAFEKTDPGVTLTSVIGASGTLVAQIAHGAPYDVFLSADLDFPRKLIKEGEADPGSLTTFAVGRLVLWTAGAQIDMSSVAAAVRSPGVHKLAIANTHTAPYGRAAMEALKALGEWAEVQPKLVVGENISQTTQFVETGNADAGFIALSIAISPKLKERGRWIEVPAGLYGSLEQGAVITGHGSSNPAARQYLAFLQGAEAREILQAFGYGLPRSP